MTPLVAAVPAALVGVLGLAVGSFLNVVIWRVPRGQSVVRPASRCPGCATPIRARDNVPVLGWLLLRGRCRACGMPIPVRYPLVELGTAAVFLALSAAIGWRAELPAFLYLGAVGVALAMIDLDVRRLPNVLVLPSYPVSLALLAIPAVVQGEHAAYVRAVSGGLALLGGYVVIVLIAPGGMGLGDVKLAGVLGIYLGWLGWPVLAVGAFLGFLLGGLLGAVLLATRVVSRRTALPFGPFMLAGALVAVLAGQAMAQAYSGLLLGA